MILSTGKFLRSESTSSLDMILCHSILKHGRGYASLILMRDLSRYSPATRAIGPK